MPLKLVPPRKGRSPNYTIRGTYLGVGVYRSAGTSCLRTARREKLRIEREIERGRFAGPQGPTFASALIGYLNAGGDRRFLAVLNEHFRDTPLADIGQAAIDEAAQTLYPDASPATRNRQVYTPVSAILKHAGVAYELRRPKGSAGNSVTRWLWPEQAWAMFEAAGKVDPEFRIFLIWLCYTGQRLSEALGMSCDRLRLGEAFAYLATSKNDEPRAVFLPPALVAELANHPRGLERGEETVFRFRKNGYLYRLMRETREAAGLPWCGFHTFCHTYGTWMRRYGGLDPRGLVGTGRWKSEKSAARYAHVVPTEEAMRAALLPTPGKRKRRR